MMLRDAIPGMSKVLADEIPDGYVILVTGSAGTFKTAFTFTAMNGILAKSGDRTGVYVTLEETREDHLRNMKSFDIKPHECLRIFDVAAFRSHLKIAGGFTIPNDDFMDMIMKAMRIGHIQEDDSDQNDMPVCYTLDSLNALLSLAHVEPAHRREFVHELFYRLKEKRITSFIIWEQDGNDTEQFFLADGVVEFGIDVPEKGVPKRYMRIKKMKGVRHQLRKFAVDVGNDGIEILTESIS
jgi:KaiC/GvpD/RAD55 family RecA-like ATPase